jgi:hypothetical protein
VSGRTGTLIKANWVVTAEHCPAPDTVRVGSIDRAGGGTVVAVRRFVNHPRIDVELLELATPVPQLPAPIPTTSGAVGTGTRIICWGQTCPTPGCGPIPRIVKELNTSILRDNRCVDINAANEICTANPGGTTGACYGDLPSIRPWLNTQTGGLPAWRTDSGRRLTRGPGQPASTRQQWALRSRALMRATSSAVRSPCPSL